MKPRCSNRRDHALTLVELLVILFVLFGLIIFVGMVLPAGHSYGKVRRIACVNNLKQIGEANRVWAADHFDQYPMECSITNNGTNELLRDGIPTSQLASWYFGSMSNEFSAPIVLHCPADDHTTAATSFTNGFGNGNLSYFTSLDATEDYPQMILTGDDNLLVNGAPVPSGLLNISTNTTAAWTSERHYKAGNIGLADGSVQEVTTNGLQMALQQTGLATNHFVIP